MTDWPHRTFCDTLEEQRQLIKNLSIFSYKRSSAILLSLIEENQTYGNRMEAGLAYSNDLDELHKKRKELRKEVKELKAQVKALQEEAGVEVEEDEEDSSFGSWLRSKEED